MTRFLATLEPAFSFAAFGADSSPDSAFYKNATEGGLSEEELGNLAKKKSNNGTVEDFSSMMVKNHAPAYDKRKDLAASKNIWLPTTANRGPMATKAKLEVLSGNSFDKSYIKGMMKDHEEDVAMFKKETASGHDPDAKAFAVATWPTLIAHLKKIQSVATTAGVSVD